MNRKSLSRGTLALLGLLAIGVPVTAQEVIPAQTEGAPATDSDSSGQLIQIVPPPADPDAAATSTPDVAPYVPLPRDGNATAKTEAATLILPLRPIWSPSESGRGEPGVFRMTGEQSSARFTLTIPSGAPPSALILSYRSSINVLPAQSDLKITVNDEPAGEITLSSFSGFTPITLPATLLKPGENVVRLDARQYHRIYCGPDASFAIWTEIDLIGSGAVVDPAQVPADAEGIGSALFAQAARPAGIAVRVDPGADPALIRSVTSRLSAYLGDAPVFRILPVWAPQSPDIPHARVTILASGRDAVSVQRGGDGALVLLIETNSAVLPDLDALLPPVAADGDVALLPPDRETSFADLGLPDTASGGHYIRQDMNFRLPDDWLVLASQTAAFSFVYGFAERLPKGALLLIKVNGQTVRLLPLDRDGGKVLPPLEVEFPANLLRPGVNSATFEAIIPGDPPDAACPPPSGPVLRILGSSTLTVPGSPAMRLPDMARALRRADGDSIQIPGVNAPTANDTARLIPLAAQLHRLGGVKRDDGMAVVVNVVGIDNVGQIPVQFSDVTGSLLAEVVYPTLDPVTVAVASATRSDPVAADPVAVEPVAQTSPPWISPTGWLAARAADLTQLAVPGDGPASDWLKRRRGDAILLQPDLAHPEQLWLLVGPNSDIAKVALALDLGRLAPGGPHGQIAVLDAAGAWSSWSPSDQPPELLEPLGLGNLRFVLGNYASWSPLAFTAGLLVLAWLSAIVALFFVLTTRGTGKR